MLCVFAENSESIHACRFVPHHDDLVFTGSSAGDLRLWRIIDNNMKGHGPDATKLKAKCHIYAPATHDLGVTTMDAIARRDDPTIMLATGGHDNIINVWQIEPKPVENPTFRLLFSRQDHSQSILSLKFSRNDARTLLLASTSIDPTVVVYAIFANHTAHGVVHEMNIVQRVSDHARYVNCAGFTPDASLLITGSNDHTVKIYGQNEVKHHSHKAGSSKALSSPTLPPLVKTGSRQLPSSKTSSSSSPTEVKNCPSEFLCPITQELMTDPVMACDGYTYEREAIASWFRRGETTSPMTNAQLANTNLVSNISLRSMIQRFLDDAAWSTVA